MTRHNLAEHLSWLLSTKASIPPADSAFPAVALSFTSTSAEPAPSNLDDAEATQLLEEPAESPTSVVACGLADMARLRTAPTSASKRGLISMGPSLPDANSPDHRGKSTSNRPAASAYSTARTSFAQTPRRHAAETPTASRDVEIMDLTDSMDQLQSPSGLRGRKRKSSELDPVITGPLLPRNARRGIQTPQGLPRASQQSFTAIDEIMDEPADPPPPYSTVPPRPNSPDQAAGSSSTIESSHHVEVQGSEHNANDRLVDFARNARQPNNPAVSYAVSATTTKVATPESVELDVMLTLLQRFLALNDAQVNELVGRCNSYKESIVEAIFDLIETDHEDASLQNDLNLATQRCDALSILSSKRKNYQNLVEEKEHTAAALKNAIRTQQGLADAKAANSACKARQLEVETECMGCLQTCQKDIEAYLSSLGSSGRNGTKRIAVQSTQASAFPLEATKESIPSSSRIAQTQVAKHHKPTLGSDNVQQKLRVAEPSPSNIDTYFSPSRKRTGNGLNGGGDARTPFAPHRHRPESAMDIGHCNDDVFENTLFSNRMGTPPVPYFDQDEDDFGMGDDEDMLEFVEEVENSGTTRSAPLKDNGRPVFAELPNNTQKKATNVSAKKSKRTFSKADDPNMEELFRFSWSHDVKKTLKERFRLKGFRENQLQAINATLGGKDTFVLMPTGGGKSLCYQLPALIESGKTIGVTVVVSPLLSLMEDQVQHLRNLHIQAFLINGETKAPEKHAIFEALSEREVQKFIQLLYITPEMLAKSSTLTNNLERLYQRQRLARLVIDEAHCVSQWGHDFRPDYKQIGDVRRKFPDVPVMALTATATENVKVDTIHNLGIAGCEVYTQSFNRANLYYEVRDKTKAKAGVQDIADLIKENHPNQTGIIYCLSKKNCEDIAKALRDEHRVKAEHYHAAIKPEDKAKVQKQWQAGKIQVIVATIAFGMGIDKPDVRFVIHHTLPKSLEGYYQETGRAGRDQKPSGCYLFYRYKDAGMIRRMIDEGEGSWEQKERQRQMFRTMIQYCENKSDCRRVQVLRYFSESFHRDECGGQCDNCNSTSTFETVDYTHYAEQAINLVRRLAPEKVTVQHCLDVFAKSKNKKITEKGHDDVDEYGAGEDLDRENIERLFSRLLSEEAIREVNVMNKSGFANQYVEVGRKCDEFKRGKMRLEMQVRTTPRARQKAPAKKSSVNHLAEQRRKMKKGTAIAKINDFEPADDVQYPMSTNVSSPVQAASTRRQVKKPVRNEVHGNGYYRDDFVVSDPEDGNCAEADGDSSSEGFEPVRVYDQPQPERVRTMGPPIKTDQIMEDLDENHRDVVGMFVMTASKLAKQISLEKNLRVVPFTDTILRAMAINFTETEEQMLKIPGIDPERVRLYGKKFCKEVSKCRKFYEELLADRPDPNDRNVIDLVSDEDDYGSIGSSDFEDEDDDGEPSAYFHPTKEVEAFNSRFTASQSAALRQSATSKPTTKAQPKGKRRKYRATVSAGTATGKRYSQGARQTSNSYNNYGNSNAGARQKPAGQRQNAGGNRGGSFVRRGRRVGSRTGGGGISAMPT